MATAAVVTSAPATVVEGLYGNASPVHGLDATLLASRISAGSFVLVEFYAEWCGHCQHLAKTYEAFAKLAAEELPELEVAAVNCPTNEHACSDHDVHRYPTIVLFPSAIKWQPKRQKKREKKERGEPEEDEVTALMSWVKHSATAHYNASREEEHQLTTPLSYAAAHASDDAPAVAPLVHSFPHGRRRHLPVPALDLLAAAKYGLYHELAAQLPTNGARNGQDNGYGAESAVADSSLPNVAEAERFSALQDWIDVLARTLPQHADGGGASAAMRELSSRLRALRSKQGAWLPRRSAWEQMLNHLGIDQWTGEWEHCVSNNGVSATGAAAGEHENEHESKHESEHERDHERRFASRGGSRGYPCGLWLLFHTAIAHSPGVLAVDTLSTIVRYVSTFFGCEECAAHFDQLAANLGDDMRMEGGVNRGVGGAADGGGSGGGGGGGSGNSGEMRVFRQLSRQPGDQSARQKASLWLWAAHNSVNTRLSIEQGEESEFAKLQWPSREECERCVAGVELVPRRRRAYVLEYLRSAYCLEPGFECWESRDAAGGQGGRSPRIVLFVVLGFGGLLVALALGGSCEKALMSSRRRRKSALD